MRRLNLAWGASPRNETTPGTHPMPRVLLALLLLAPLALAQKPDPAMEKENAESVKKQKTLAADQLKTIKITKPTLIETGNLLVYSDQKEEAFKAVADAAQKSYERAFKDLKFGEKDKVWTGKLTLYVLPDRATEYTKFVKLVELRNGKVESDEMHTFKVQVKNGEEPYVAITAGATSKTVEADLKVEAARTVAVALIAQKGGATPPTWVQEGMGKAIAWRAEGGKALDTHKTKVKGLFTKAKVGLFKADDVWGDKRGADYDTLTISLSEYILYGAGGESLDKFLSGFRATEDRKEPTTATALDAADWKAEVLDAAWKKWVMGGK